MPLAVPRRIASLQPSATVTLRDLGRLELLVACTKYCREVCPEIRDRSLAVVADSWTAQAAQIRAVEADLVIASVPYQEKALVEILKSGIPFLALAPRRLADIYSDISLIARLVDAQEQGRELILSIEAEIRAVRQRTESLPRPRVFSEEWGKPLIASQPWVAELVEAAGGEFIASPGRQVSSTEVEAAMPEVLIAAWCGAGDRVPLEKILRDRKWDELPAAINRRVYSIRDEYLNTPASTLLCGLRALAAAIHPDHFPQPSGLRWIGPER